MCDHVGVTNIEDCIPNRPSILSEHTNYVHAADSNSRPLEEEIGSLTKWLASQESCLGLSNLLYKPIFKKFLNKIFNMRTIYAINFRLHIILRYNISLLSRPTRVCAHANDIGTS
jgi:hypothetical protein